jgi:hypothetical protein
MSSPEDLALDFPRPGLWKTILLALPVWLAFGLVLASE